MNEHYDKPNDLNDWHKKSKFNEFDIVASDYIGCFFCLSLFRTRDVLAEMQWCDLDSTKGKTAICENCFIDSILPLDFNGIKADKILKMMNTRWFIAFDDA